MPCGGYQVRTRTAVTLGALAGCINVPLDLWLRPDVVGYVLIALASSVLALATGQAEGAVMMSKPMDDPLPGMEPDPVPYPEPPVEEQDHLAAKWGEEGPGDDAAASMDSQP